MSLVTAVSGSPAGGQPDRGTGTATGGPRQPADGDRQQHAVDAQSRRDQRRNMFLVIGRERLAQGTSPAMSIPELLDELERKKTAELERLRAMPPHQTWSAKSDWFTLSQIQTIIKGQDRDGFCRSTKTVFYNAYSSIGEYFGHLLDSYGQDRAAGIADSGTADDEERVIGPGERLRHLREKAFTWAPQDQAVIAWAESGAEGADIAAGMIAEWRDAIRDLAVDALSDYGFSESRCRALGTLLVPHLFAPDAVPPGEADPFEELLSVFDAAAEAIDMTPRAVPKEPGVMVFVAGDASGVPSLEKLARSARLMGFTGYQPAGTLPDEP